MKPTPSNLSTEYIVYVTGHMSDLEPPAMPVRRPSAQSWVRPRFLGYVRVFGKIKALLQSCLGFPGGNSARVLTNDLYVAPSTISFTNRNFFEFPKGASHVTVWVLKKLFFGGSNVASE